MSWRDFIGAVTELFTIRDPYEPLEPPHLVDEYYDWDGGKHQIMRANSAGESTRHMQGHTIQGDRSVVSTHLTDFRRGYYDVHVEDWETEGILDYFEDPRYNVDPAYQAAEEMIYYNQD